MAQSPDTLVSIMIPSSVCTDMSKVWPSPGGGLKGQPQKISLGSPHSTFSIFEWPKQGSQPCSNMFQPHGKHKQPPSRRKPIQPQWSSHIWRRSSMVIPNTQWQRDHHLQIGRSASPVFSRRSHQHVPYGAKIGPSLSVLEKIRETAYRHLANSISFRRHS